MSDLRSTFPLDEATIARRVLRQIITDPITWVPLLPPVGLYTFLDLPGWLSLTCGGSVLAGLAVFWKKQWQPLAARQRQTAIAAHNLSQNQLLAGVARQFSSQGHLEHAAWLNRFLLLKQSLEKRIHEDGQLTPQKIQLERLIDALCFEARDQLILLINSRSHDFASISEAFATLENASAQIDVLLGPGQTPSGHPSNLEEITSRLREETEIARRVQERLHTPDFHSTPSSTPLQEQ